MHSWLLHCAISYVINALTMCSNLDNIHAKHYGTHGITSNHVYIAVRVVEYIHALDEFPIFT